MDDRQFEQLYHPNIARMVAAYDTLTDRCGRGEISDEEAFAQAGQLEARDDEGVRWGIDPGTGRFVRKTAFGDQEYDDPPTFGVRTADAFSYTDGSLVDDPSERLQFFAADPRATSGLAGATRAHLRPEAAPVRRAGLLSSLLRASLPVRAGVAAGIAVIVVVVVLHGHHKPSNSPSAPSAPAGTSVTSVN